MPERLRSEQPLLEREEELAVIDSCLASAREGSGRLLVLEGHAGVGKTTLLAAAQARGNEHGMKVLSARCSELEQEFPYGIPRQLFEGELAEASRDRRAQLLAGAATLARPLFEPAARESPEAETDADGFPLLHGLFWLTSNLTTDAPVLLAVDDLHWADASSSRFLMYLAQRLGDLPVALAVATRVRPTQREPDPVTELASAAVGSAVEVQELSPGGVREFVRRTMPEAGAGFCEACARVTAGNPFLLRELVGELATQGIEPADEHATRVESLAPEALSQMTLVRLVRLGKDAVSLAEAISILGDRVLLSHAATLAGLRHDQAAAAADALVGANLLTGAEPFSFVHPLVRSAVYHGLPVNARARLHRSAADLERGEGSSPEVVAIHLLHAHRAGERWVVDCLMSAAREALVRGSPETAVSYLERAWLEPPDPEARAEVARELGLAEAAAGRATAPARLEAALELTDSPRERARLLLALGRAQYALGHLPDAVATFERGMAEAEGADPELARRLLSEFSQLGILMPDRQPDVGPRIAGALASIEDPPTPAGRDVLATAALLAAMAAEPRAHALELARRALGDDMALLREAGPDNNSLYAITGALFICDELADDEELLGAVIEAAGKAGSVMAFATASYARSYPRLLMGKLADALVDAEAAIDAYRYGWAQYLPVAYAVAIRCHVERGELELARGRLAEMEDGGWHEHGAWSQVVAARGVLLMAEGRPAEAIEDFLEWGRIWPIRNPAFLADWRSQAAVAAARLGDRDRAVELAREELELVRPFGSPRALGTAMRALGLAQGGEEGIATLAESVAVLEGSEARLELCRALVDWGAALRRGNQRGEAREPLRRGLETAERLGARALADAAAEELKLTGARPRRRWLSGVDALTPGELRVAGLAAQGMSNREIAESLFVTVKAVQWHLRHVYQKLDVSRDGLAGALAETSD